MPTTPPPARPGRFLGRFFVYVLIAFLITIPVRLFVAQPFVVSGASMEPSLKSNEYLVIDRLTYQYEKPQRGDIVIFRYPLDPALYFVKRIVALPGESVQVEGNRVSVITTNGVPYTLDEPYATPESRPGETVVTLKNNEYFVMGDHRSASADSREWGPLQEKFIVGRALVRLWPFSTLALFPGGHTFDIQ